MSSNNGSSMSSNNGGSDSADGDSGLVYADGVLVNDGGLHNMLNGVDSVGLRDSVGLFDLNGVRLGHMSVNNDFPFDGNGDSDGDRGSGDGRGSNGDSGLGGLGLTSDISVGGSLADRLLLSVGVSGLNSLGTNLDLTVTDNFVVGLMDSGSCMDMFLNTVSYNSSGSGSISSMSQGSQGGGSVVTTRG